MEQVDTAKKGSDEADVIEIGSVTEMTKGFDFSGKMEVKLGDYVEWDS